ELERAVQRVLDDEAAVNHRRQAVAKARLAQLGEQQPHEVVFARQSAADVERAIERLFHQARDLSFVRYLEAGIEVRFERKFMKEREAERVNRADRNVACTLPDAAPPLGVAAGRFPPP